MVNGEMKDRRSDKKYSTGPLMAELEPRVLRAADLPCGLAGPRGAQLEDDVAERIARLHFEGQSPLRSVVELDAARRRPDAAAPTRSLHLLV